jgi:hypothetical protein
MDSKPGLSYYQERQWVAAINKYGTSILDKSLLSQNQKDILKDIANRESKILSQSIS